MTEYRLRWILRDRPQNQLVVNDEENFQRVIGELEVDDRLQAFSFEQRSVGPWKKYAPTTGDKR